MHTTPIRLRHVAVRLALVALLAFAPSAAARAEDAAYKEGDVIEIFWGGQWWPGVVRKVEDGRCWVHYDGYADSWDMWKETKELRRRAAAAPTPAPAPAPVPAPAPAPAPAAPPAAAPAVPGAPVADVGPKPPGDPVVGERCEASWNESWYEIDVLEVKDGRYFVHWRGYGKESDEWLPRDRIRRKGEDREVLPRRGREGDGGGRPPAEMVGRDVEVFWHGSWWAAKVLATDGTRLRIRYTDATTGTTEEWAVRERVREVGAKVRVRVRPADVPGTKGLEGLWWRAYGAGGNQTWQFFRFFPDGRLYVGVSLYDEAVDADAAQLANPDECGAYGVADGRMNIELGGDAREWKPLEFVQVSRDEWKLNGVPTFRARKLARGTRLAGTWMSMNAAAFGDIDGVARAGGSGYEFRADGTYRHRRWQTVAVTKGGEHGTSVVGHEGTYEIEGNRLRMVHPAGTQDFMIVPMGLDDAGTDILRISWDMLRRRP